MMSGLNDRSTLLSLLLTRRSAKARDLVTPGPTEDELATILQAAARVPDHGKLAPWAFVIIRDRAAFADVLTRLYKSEKPEAGRLELESLTNFAGQAPVLVALISTPREGKIPLWEQQLSAGAAAQNLLIATHAHGYAGNWLTTAAAFLPGIEAALGHPGGRLAGFFFLGTPKAALDERPRPEMARIVSNWPREA